MAVISKANSARMGDDGVVVKRVSKSCASPGIHILRSWQGIMEILLRVAIIVSGNTIIIIGGKWETTVAWPVPITAMHLFD